jgi:hypothetical protein
VQLKLSISRLRMVQQKDAAKAKQQRREMAQLIEVGRLSVACTGFFSAPRQPFRSASSLDSTT